MPHRVRLPRIEKTIFVLFYWVMLKRNISYVKLLKVGPTQHRRVESVKRVPTVSGPVNYTGHDRYNVFGNGIS